MLATLSFALSVTLPIFLSLLIGVALRYVGWLTPRWVDRLSVLVFYVSLPLLMFSSVVRFPVSTLFQPIPTAVGIGITLLTWGGYQRLNKHRQQPAPESTVAEQAVMRGNLGIVGISLCLNAYGPAVLPKASLLMAMMTITYNILSVYIFVKGMGQGDIKALSLIKNLLKNPLIVGILIGALAVLLGLRPPSEWFEFTEWWLQWTLPLALVAIGGSLNYASFLAHRALCIEVSLIKLIALPAAAVLFMLLFGLQGEMLGIIFLFCASPVAAVSFVMAKAYKANANLAATLVVVTTLASLLSVSVGVFALRSLGVM